MSDLGLLLGLAPLGLELGLPDPVARRSKAVTEAKFFFSFTPGRLEPGDELEKCWVGEPGAHWWGVDPPYTKKLRILLAPPRAAKTALGFKKMGFWGRKRFQKKKATKPA